MKRIVFSVIAMLMASVAVISCKDGDNLVNVQQEVCVAANSDEVIAALARDIEFYKNSAAILAPLNAIGSGNKRAIEDGYMRLQTYRPQLINRAALEEQMSIAFESMAPLPRPMGVDEQLVESVLAFLLKSFADDMVQPHISIEQLALDYGAAINKNVYLKESKEYFAQVVLTFSDVIVSASTMGLASAEREFENCMRRKMGGMNKFEMAAFVIGIPESFLVVAGACLCETITDGCK
ncbi:MAG: hypothetical protein IJU72_05540 [Bacteroidales bacterium]|nr:hypothetical protein [Bacteroidales bacterium]